MIAGKLINVMYGQTLFVRGYFLARLMLVVGLQLYTIQTIRLGQTKILANQVIVIRAQAEQERMRIADNRITMKAIQDFMERTVDRWKWLQENNKDLKVPYVQEPSVGPHPDPTEFMLPH